MSDQRRLPGPRRRGRSAGRSWPGSAARCAARPRSGSAMSTPSSIVGEQYSSGSSPSRNCVLALLAVVAAAPARCARGRACPAQLRGHVAVQVAEERVDPGDRLAVERLAQRVGGAGCAVAGAASAARRRLEPVARRRRRRPSRRGAAGQPSSQHLEQVGDDLAGVVDGQLPARAGAARPGAGSGRTRRGRTGKQRRGGRPAGRPRDTRRRPARRARPSRHAPTGSIRCWRGQPLQPLEPVLGQAVDVDGQHPAQLVEQDPAQLLAQCSGSASRQRRWRAGPAARRRRRARPGRA